MPTSPSKNFYENLFTIIGHMDPILGVPNPIKLRCFRRFGALSIDGGLTNSTFTILMTSLTLADPISSIISALTAAYGPLYFGAPKSAYRIMTKLEIPENIP